MKRKQTKIRYELIRDMNECLMDQFTHTTRRIEEISQKIGLSERTIRRALAEMKKKS